MSVLEYRDIENLSRKERERMQRKKDILEAARHVFAEKGYEKATLDEIAAKAEFGKGTLYNYFESKQDIFTTAYKEGMYELRDSVQMALEGAKSVKDGIHSLIETTLEYFEKNRSFLRILLVEQAMSHSGIGTRLRQKMHERHSEYTGEIASYLGAAMKRGDIRTMDPTKLAASMQALIHVYTFEELRSESPSSLTLNADNIFSMLWNGIGKD